MTIKIEMGKILKMPMAAYAPVVRRNMRRTASMRQQQQQLLQQNLQEIPLLPAPSLQQNYPAILNPVQDAASPALFNPTPQQESSTHGNLNNEATHLHQLVNAPVMMPEARDVMTVLTGSQFPVPLHSETYLSPGLLGNDVGRMSDDAVFGAESGVGGSGGMSENNGVQLFGEASGSSLAGVPHFIKTEVPEQNPAQLFDVQVDSPELDTKQSTYRWFAEKNQLYTDWNSVVPMKVSVPDAENSYVLCAKLVFADDENAFVPMCVNCSQQKSDAEYVCEGRGGSGSMATSTRRFVKQKLAIPEPGSTCTRFTMKLTCRNSCLASESKKRERMIVFQLYNESASSVVLSELRMLVRVCASPRRDYESDRNKWEAAGIRTGNKRKFESGSDEIPADKKNKKKKSCEAEPVAESKSVEDFLSELKSKERPSVLFPATLSKQEVDLYLEVADSLHLAKFVKECYPHVFKEFETRMKPIFKIRNLKDRVE
ncbi:unnamed protein product [Notodromas monacha]|uniref:p53 DNA-binding domain-containing protein n=1 Tax=Notodromas monacha TaxID=399045 RepID=A0A7R9GIF9_9CRUS|nr:unnamed protein product [Notodromas monacha]CAG0923921.1 unnamed protein product [Notodromas monacha]